MLHIVGSMPFPELFVFFRCIKQRLVRNDAAGSMCRLQHFHQLRNGERLSLLPGTACAAVCHKGSAVFREDGMFCIQVQGFGEGIAQPL